MPTCPKCMSSVEEGEVFCFNCGFNLPTDMYVQKTKVLTTKGLGFSTGTITQFQELESRLKEL